MSRRTIEVAAGRRCLAPGCGRMVSRGEALCRDHRRTGWGKEVERALRQVMSGAVDAVDGGVERRRDGEAERRKGGETERETEGRNDGKTEGRKGRETEGRKGGEMEREERRRVAEVFRRRVARGEYGGLFDEPVRRILAQAAEEKALDQELGALRFVMARLLMEDGDPVRVALGISRVATAAARIVKTGASIEEPRDTLQEWITEHLRELDQERDMRLAARELARREIGGEIPEDGMLALEEGGDE